MLTESLVFSPGAKYLSWVRGDGRIMIWGLHELSESQPEVGRKLSPIQPPLRFSQDGRFCGTAHADKLELWDLTVGSPKVDLSGAPSPVTHMGEDLPWGFSADGELAIAMLDRTLILVRTTAANDGGLFGYSRISGIECVDGFAFNHTNTLLALVDPWARSVYIVDTAYGSLSRILRTDDPLGRAVAFSKTGRLVVTGRAFPYMQSYRLFLWERPLERSECVVLKFKKFGQDNGKVGLGLPREVGQDANSWIPFQIVFPSDEDTVVVVWAVVWLGTLSVLRGKLGHGELFVTRARLDTSSPWVESCANTKLDQKDMEKAKKYRVTALGVSEKNEFALAYDNKIVVQCQRGNFQLTTNTSRASSLSFGTGNESIVANGRALSLKEPMEDVDSTGVQLSRVSDDGNPGVSRNWLTWNGRPIVCIPDNDPVLYHEVWGHHIALVYGTGYVTFLSVSSDQDEDTGS